MSENLDDLCPVKIEDEYKKNPQLKPKDIEEFKNWTLSKPNFPKNIPAGVLALYLHSADYRIEEAKKIIENSLKLRSNTPEFFVDRDPDSPPLKHIWELVDFWVSMESTPENNKVFYTGFLSSDATNYNFGEACKAFLLAGECYVLTHGTIPGLVIVMDAKGGTYKHLLKSKIHLIMKFLSYIQDAQPVHIKQVHIINVIPVIDKAMFLAKPFIKKELLDNMYFHSGSNLTEFYKKVPKEILPIDLGGNRGTREQLKNEMMGTIRKLKDWMNLEEKYLRLKPYGHTSNEEILKTEERIEELPGSFTTLCID